MAGRKSSTTLLLVCLVALACSDAAQGRLSFLRGLLWSSLTAPAAGGAVAQSACSPQQVLLSLGSDPTEMHLTWKTTGSNCPSEVLFEKLGHANARLHQRQQQLQLLLNTDNTDKGIGYSYVLSERDMCDSPAASNAFVWNLHRATMNGLEPSALYRYRIEGDDRHWHFQTAPAPSPRASFTFLGFGDMGDAVHAAAKSPGAASTLLRLRREAESTSHPAQLMLHVGDLSYANGNPDIWDSFIEGLQPFAASVPYMVAVGNHEYGYTAHRGSSQRLTDPSGASEPYQPSWGNYGPDSQGECGAVTARRFHMPNRHKGRRANAPFWYSFEYGSVHFTTISTEHDLVPGSRQYEWLAEDLAAVDRCTTPWLVVLLHRPMYVVYPHKSNREVGEHIRSQIEPLLLRYNVDMTISGHVHSYYRTCAVLDEHCVEDESDGLRTFTLSTATGAMHTAAGTSSRSANMTSPAGAGPEHTSLRGAPTADERHQQQPDQNHAAGSVEGGAPGLQAPELQQRRHGMVHFVIGSAGHRLSDIEHYQMNWCSAALQVWGYGRFTVKGDQSLVAEYVSSQTGEVLDAVEVRASADDRRSLCSTQQKGTALIEEAV